MKAKDKITPIECHECGSRRLVYEVEGLSARLVTVACQCGGHYMAYEHKGARFRALEKDCAKNCFASPVDALFSYREELLEKYSVELDDALETLDQGYRKKEV